MRGKHGKMLAALAAMVIVLSACGVSQQQQFVTPVRLKATGSPASTDMTETAPDETLEEPTDSAGYTNRGIAYYERGEFEKAIQDYDKAIELEPDNVEAFVNRGSAYVRMQQVERALEDYDKAIEINPDLAESYTGRGAIYYLQQDYEQAIEDYTTAIELDPEFTGAYFNRGLAYATMGETEEAAADFEKIIELDNDPFWQQRAEQELQNLPQQNGEDE